MLEKLIGAQIVHVHSDSVRSSIITFYGESKPLAAIESIAGSGSGSAYGAFVSLYCQALDIDEYSARW